MHAAMLFLQIVLTVSFFVNNSIVYTKYISNTSLKGGLCTSSICVCDLCKLLGIYSSNIS